MGLQVLIVEDESLIVMDLQAILEDAGHTVVGAASTMREALRIASLNHADVAIVDIELARGPDGIEAAKRLQDGHDVRSLFLTGRAYERERAMESVPEPLGFLTKPFQPEAVVDALVPLARRD